MLSTKKFQLNFKIQPKTVMILKSHSNTPNFEIAFFFFLGNLLVRPISNEVTRVKLVIQMSRTYLEN